jgi:hypothetical protein
MRECYGNEQVQYRVVGRGIERRKDGRGTMGDGVLWR